MRVLSHKRFILLLTSLILTCSIYFTSEITMAEDKRPTVMEHWSAQIIADRMEESISFGREIKAYYDKKYPLLNGRIYI